MFLFAVGFGVGPQFVRGIATDGAPQAIFAVVVSVLCLLAVYIAAIVSGYGPGLAAGLLAGAQTISASIGLATDAINQSGLTPEEAKAAAGPDPGGLCHHLPVRHGRHRLDPRVPRAQAPRGRHRRRMRPLRARDVGRRAQGRHSSVPGAQRELRAYRIRENGKATGKTVAAGGAARGGERIFIEGLRSGGEIVPFTAETVLKAGDVVAVSGRREVLVNLLGEGDEVDDTELLDVPVEAVDVLLTTKDTRRPHAGRGLAGALHPRRLPQLDPARLGGGEHSRPAADRSSTAATSCGSRAPRRTSSASSRRRASPTGRRRSPNMVLVGLAILIGGLIGAAVLPIGGVPITLTTSGGALIAGIFVGWLRTVKPQIGNVPQPTLWFMNSVGLNVFIAMVGISSGPTFIAGLKEAGFGIFFWGLFATGVPMLLAPLIGKYIFRFDPAINLGCCGGARTSTASVAMVGEVAKSDVPMLGYTVPYAVSNTLADALGPGDRAVAHVTLAEPMAAPEAKLFDGLGAAFAIRQGARHDPAAQLFLD